MSKIQKICNQSIEKSLIGVSRQYLAGNLKKPQELTYFLDEALEIGITKYVSYSIEKPHKHDIAKEYQLVLDGYTEYIDVETKEKYCFTKGDFYMIEKGTAYAQKSSAGTQILFIKVPSINDKIEILADEEIEKWYQKKI